MPTPFTPRHVRQMSPPLSVSASQAFTIGQQQKINVVTRLAIEGKAKHGQDGASIRVYLKVGSGVRPMSSAMLHSLNYNSRVTSDLSTARKCQSRNDTRVIPW